MRPSQVIGGLVAINVLLIVAGWLLVPAAAKPAGVGIRVGLVFDVGGKNDKSFNTAAWRGLERVRDELGVDIEFIEPTEGNDRESALRSLAAKHVDLVIGVGFIFGPDLERLATQFPDVKFAGIDYSPGPSSPSLPNLAALRFREQEGSFLVGAIAGLTTRTHVVGFVGGMKIPLIRKFEAGYRAGVLHVCPTCDVKVAYAGTEPKAFADAPLGKELGAAQYDAGADIIFTAAGKTGDGVFAAARQRDLRAIGVDSDQFDMAPCCIVTSMIKRVDVAVVDIVKDVIAHRFAGGIHELGLAEDGVGFVSDERNRSLLPLEVVQRVKKLGAEIIAGKIEVPDKMIRATLDKRYGPREVLHRARFEVARGTVHALVGENGAGKSTLVKILAGVIRGDGGTLDIDGTSVDLARWDRRAARRAGIGIAQQHGAFAGTLTVVENAVLGVEPRRGLLLDLAPTAEALATLGRKIGLAIDPWARTDRLSLGAAQRAEIVAALHLGAKLLILDEPTAVLAPVEVDGLLETLRALAAAGTTIVLVTHKLDEVAAVADAVTVLRAGASVAEFRTPLPVREIARVMVGAELPEPGQAPIPDAAGKPALVLDHVGVGDVLVDLDLEVRAGEIVGVAGVDGNGQRELALAIAGLVAHRGRVRIGTHDVTRASAASRLGVGLAHVPEDRQHGGVVLDATVGENLSLGRADITGRFRIDRAAVAAHADAQIAVLDIRPADRDAIVRSLSGGNQQKVVIGRELSRPGLAAVVAAQPTRGVDLGAVVRIHDRLRAAAIAGAGVLVISADLDELLALCHRVVVLLRGRIVGERSGAELRSDGARGKLGALMVAA